jgi:ribosomal protein S18 acetylase RimI-like enzyme
LERLPEKAATHVSGISVAPERWGQRLARAMLPRFETVLCDLGYDTAQLFVLGTNSRAG